MGQDPGAVSASVGTETGTERPQDPERLREDIEQTRQELGDTVAALSDKTDVKARARERVTEIKQTVAQKREDIAGRARESSPEGASSAAVQIKDKARQNPIPAAAIAAFVGGFIAGRISGR